MYCYVTLYPAQRDWTWLRNTWKLFCLRALARLPQARVILSVFILIDLRFQPRALNVSKKHDVRELHLQLQYLNFFHPYPGDIDIQQSPEQAAVYSSQHDLKRYYAMNTDKAMGSM